MIHEVFILLNAISFAVLSSDTVLPAVAQTPAATQLTPISATVQQSVCTGLNALPLLSSGQKETWLVGRATRTQGQNDVNKNGCRLFDFGPDCVALQFTSVTGQDGKSREVSMYAYNSRTDTVAYIHGKHVQIDTSYEVYGEQMETKLFVTRGGAAVMATNSVSEAGSPSLEFAKIAQSKDGNWVLIQSCNQLLTCVLFRAELVASDPERKFVEYYRRSIDDTLKQFKINTSSMVEAQLTFPFPVPEIPGSVNAQPISPPAVSTSVPAPPPIQSPYSAAPTTFVYISAPPVAPHSVSPPPTVGQIGPPAQQPTIIYGSPSPPVLPPAVPSPPSFSQPTVIYAPVTPPAIPPPIQTTPPPSIQTIPPPVQTLSPAYVPPPALAQPNPAPAVIYAPAPAPSPQIPSTTSVTPPAIVYAPSTPPPPSSLPPPQIQFSSPVSPPPPVYSYSLPVSSPPPPPPPPPQPPAVVYAPAPLAPAQPAPLASPAYSYSPPTSTSVVPYSTSP